jgi:hypothetical protein
MNASKQTITTIAGVNVNKMDSDGSLIFKAGMEIDADGSPHAYHPISSKGLDSLENAKDQDGRFVGIALKQNGQPAVQGGDDPAPGFFVSTTSLQDDSKASTDPARYVDSEKIPFLVLPGHMPGGARLGDFAVLIHAGSSKPPCFAICGDTGPTHKIGEASIAAAQALGIPSSPRTGGEDAHVVQYILFVNSGNGKPRTLQEINDEGARLFADWGGMARVNQAFS